MPGPPMVGFTDVCEPEGYADCVSGGLPKGFVQPCLLLLLKEEEDHGYGLVAGLKCLGVDDDTATIYRSLRGLEAGAVVRSSWEMGRSGPARRGPADPRPATRRRPGHVSRRTDRHRGGGVVLVAGIGNIFLGDD
ncbi:MAG: hypothetical protein ACRDV9_05940, partial [Acidimicrobiia bacterium]